jgi:hypothetical protein
MNPVGGEELIEHWAPEATAEHRGVAQELTRKGGKCVDLFGDDLVERVGQTIGAACLANDSEHFTEEKRVTVGTSDDMVKLVRT